MKISKHIAIGVTLTLAVCFVHAEEKSFKTFEEAKPELQRLLECRDWQKMYPVTKGQSQFEGLPMAQIHPRKIPGIIAKSQNSDEYMGVGYATKIPLAVYGQNVTEFSIGGSDSAGGYFQSVEFKTKDIAKIRQAIETSLNIKFEQNSASPGLAVKKDRKIITLVKNEASGAVGLTCGENNP